MGTPRKFSDRHSNVQTIRKKDIVFHQSGGMREGNGIFLFPCYRLSLQHRFRTVYRYHYSSYLLDRPGIFHPRTGEHLQGILHRHWPLRSRSRTLHTGCIGRLRDGASCSGRRTRASSSRIRRSLRSSCIAGWPHPKTFLRHSSRTVLIPG